MAGLVTSFGSGAMTNSIHDIGDAGCILAIGTNTTETHPVTALEIVRAVRNGGKLVVANPRDIGLVRFADVWLRHSPGSDVALLMGMMRVIVDEGLLDSSFIEERCENFDAFKESLKAFDLDSVERITEVPAEKVVEAACARLLYVPTPQVSGQDPRVIARWEIGIVKEVGQTSSLFGG